MSLQSENDVESWKGFPWILRREDSELRGEMVKEVRQHYAEGVELSGKRLTTDRSSWP